MRTTSFGLALLTILLVTSEQAWACPFCSAVSQTFAEEIETMEVALFAKLVKAADAADFDPETGEMPRSEFKVIEILKGEEWVSVDDTVEIHFFGTAEPEKKYFITGTEPPDLSWGAPVALADRAYDYIFQVIELPAGYERLKFFLPYLEDEEEVLRRDAYDEFAKTPYEGVIAIQDAMDREALVQWIQDPDVSVSHRRLYLTMLGVCGKPEDAELLATLMSSGKKEDKAGLNALVACYLSLKGEAGLPTITDLFLANPDARYEDTYAAIMALRFHGNEADLIPRELLLDGMRAVLARADLADLVIPDLARWEDWSAIEDLKTLFLEADEESNWLRVPVINYLRACPLPEAEEALQHLQEVDPDAMKRAAAFFPYSQFAGPDRSSDDGTEAEPGADSTTSSESMSAPLSSGPQSAVPGLAERVRSMVDADRREQNPYPGLWWGLPVAAAVVLGTVLLLGKASG